MNALASLSVPPSAFAPADPERWVDEHGDTLYRYALARLRRPELAEDLVQEALLAAVRTQEKFGGRSTERSWLVGILKHKICDHFRRAGRETTFTDLECAHADEGADFDDAGHWILERAPEEWTPEGEAAMRRAEFWQALQLCLGRLPERLAQVFTLREVDDVPSREICELLGISETNLWVMLHRARSALRKDLEATFFEGNGGAGL